VTGPAPASSRRGLRRWLQWAGTLVSAGLFINLLARQDWANTWHTMNLVPAWLWPLSILCMATGMVLNAARWHGLLRAQGTGVPFREVIKIVFAGAFASNFLPSTIGGDAYRVVSILRYSSSRSVALASVVVDRALNVIAYATYLPFIWLALGSPLGLVQAPPAGAAFVPDLQQAIQKVRAAFTAWARRPRSLLVGFVISWLSIIVVIFAVWLLAWGLEIPVSLGQVLGVSTFTYFLLLLPISINGYGLREFTVTALYMRLGATLEQATTLAILTRFFMLLETLPGALWLSQVFPGAEQQAGSHLPPAGPPQA